LLEVATRLWLSAVVIIAAIAAMAGVALWVLQTTNRITPERAMARRSALDIVPTSQYKSVMSTRTEAKIPMAPGRRKLLDAALSVIRTKGYAATSIDELCAEAEVAKGSFFHHFRNKGELGVAAAEYWSDRADALFAAAPYHRHADPLDRVLGYIDFRKAILTGKIPEFTCLVGTMVQEVYETNPEIRDACEASVSGHAAEVEKDIAEAMRLRGIRGIRAGWTARSLALHTQCVLQGAFILAKAKGSAAIAAESIDHLRRYVELLFKSAKRKGKEAS
jgi:TetR/AcrR family transcriptional regulator, transcriptional repressor for nem operon